MFTQAADVKTYTLAGHATLTLTSQKTGARYTFQINQAKDENGERKPMWFVGLLTGPDNYADYAYVGLLTQNGDFRLTAKSRYTGDSTPVKAFQYFWKWVSDGEMPPHMEIRHEGSCGRCGRKLTVPESIDRGIGPECFGRMGVA
jgi:hypothetical protein